MEIKINRRYGTTRRISSSGCRCGSSFFRCWPAGWQWASIWPAGCAGDGNGQLAVHPRRSALCRYGICEIPRHDGGKVFRCMAAVGISCPQAADLPADQFVLGSYAGTAQTGKEALRRKLWCICPEVYNGTWSKKEVQQEMLKKLKELLHRDPEQFRIPRSVQEVIPIRHGLEKWYLPRGAEPLQPHMAVFRHQLCAGR